VSFALPDASWAKAAEELVALGRARLAMTHDRMEMEQLCEEFVLSRKVGGKGHPSPEACAKAWEKVGRAAQELADAIDHLDEINAASFSFIDGHGPATEEFVANLKCVPDQARFIATIERFGENAPARTDAVRDWLFEAVMNFWISRGGKAAASVSPEGGSAQGPLIRFLQNTFAVAVQHADGRAPTATALRGMIRKHAVHSRTRNGELKA